MKVVRVKFKGSPREVAGDIKSEILWENGFPVMSRKIARKVFSLVWVALIELEANLAGKIVHKVAKGPFVEGKCLVIQRIFRGKNDSKSAWDEIGGRQPEIMGIGRGGGPWPPSGFSYILYRYSR